MEPNPSLPKNWSDYVKAAILHVISLANLSMARVRGWPLNCANARIRLKAKLEQAEEEIERQREEIRIKDARMLSIPARRRLHYRPTERLSILELKAARCWSGAETARRFLVKPATIGYWQKRVIEDGEYSLLKTPEPVNRFPDFVRYIVRRLKVLVPFMGKKKIAQTLARAGLHLGVTTVKRILEEKGQRPAESPEEAVKAKNQQIEIKRKPVASKYSNHVWLVDLTVIPTSAGFWAPWFPFSIPSIWPLAWWLGVVVDHFSRRVMGYVVFGKEPNSKDIRAFLARTISECEVTPKYIISDRGGQFDCPGFRDWCEARGIKARYCAAERRGATAVIERFFRSLKSEWFRCITVPLRREEMRKKVDLYLNWFLEHRPHQGLGGRTPNEVYEGLDALNEKPRFEPRPNWPEDSSCALPAAKARRGKVVKLELVVNYHGGERLLPLVELKKTA